MRVIIKLHEAVNIPTLLYCSETWTLNKGEMQEADRVELWAWKNMIGLPRTTPNAAVMYTTGAMYPSIRIQEKMLMFLHNILTKDDDSWPKIIYQRMEALNIGWAKQANTLLTEWNLPSDPGTIASKAKTKTKSIIDKLDHPQYKREPNKFLVQNNNLAARTMIMGRYGMLQCAANFKGSYGVKLCKTCNVIDDEPHRGNQCIVWEGINRYGKEEKIKFEQYIRRTRLNV